MLSVFWLGLLARAAASALVVVAATVAAEAAGPFWGGLIVSLPIGAGPAYVMLALQHDAAFIAVSALGSFAVNAATFVFLAALGLLATRVHWGWALAGGLCAWTASVLLIRQVEWDAVSASLLNIATIAVSLWLTRSMGRGAGGAARGAVRRRWYELPARAATVRAGGGQRGDRQPSAGAGADRDGGGVPGGVHQFLVPGAAADGRRGIGRGDGERAAGDAGIRTGIAGAASGCGAVGGAGRTGGGVGGIAGVVRAADGRTAEAGAGGVRGWGGLALVISCVVMAVVAHDRLNACGLRLRIDW